MFLPDSPDGCIYFTHRIGKRRERIVQAVDAHFARMNTSREPVERSVS
jgi:hypothetical protein